MSTSRQLPVVAALVGAAALGVGNQAQATGLGEASSPPGVFCELPRSADGTSGLHSEQHGTPEPLPTLASLLESRARAAAAQRHHDDVERMGELWLTLHRRGQLERTVERGEGYLTVALRHQQVSTHRTEARASRFRSLEPGPFETDGGTAGLGSSLSGVRPDQIVDAQQWLDRLQEPYRTAVELSLQGWSRREVADEMGVADATVRKWMQRLRERELDAPWQ